MILYNFDLYDLGAVLVRIRNDIENPVNIEVADKLISIFDDGTAAYYDNIIRRTLSDINSLDKSLWGFVFYNNLYTNIRLLKDGRIYGVLKTVCVSLQAELIAGNYKKAEALADAVHFLPEIIAEVL